MMNKDFSNVDCCLNCKNFTWWDGDYCCVSDMKIHQFGFGNQNGGYFGTTYMNEDIDNTMKIKEECDDWEKYNHRQYIQKEYLKFKDFENKQNQYYAHIIDKWDFKQLRYDYISTEILKENDFVPQKSIILSYIDKLKKWYMYSDEPIYIIGLSEDTWDYYWVYVDRYSHIKSLTCCYYLKDKPKDIKLPIYSKSEILSLLNTTDYFEKNNETLIYGIQEFY